MPEDRLRKDTRRENIVTAAHEYSFTVIFEPLPGGGYQVIIPALPEIITCGRTLQESRKIAKHAVRCDLEGMVKHGQPFPKDIIRQPKTEKLRIALEVA